MKKTLIMKAAVLGTIACCSFSGPGIAANIQDTNEPGVGRTAVDEAKREAVHSTWMDRTDVVIGIGPKSTKKLPVTGGIILLMIARLPSLRINLNPLS